MRFLLYTAVSIIFFTSCHKDSEYSPLTPEIKEIKNNYSLKNGDTVEVEVKGKNGIKPDLNRFYIDGNEIISKEVLNKTAFEIVLPETTFSKKRMSNVLSFYNGNEYAEIELFADGFPTFETLSKKFTYPNEELHIEGLNLSYNPEYSEVLFLSENGTVSAPILSGNNFIIKVIIPKEAISGLILYKTFLKEEELPRILIYGSIEIRK